MTAVESRTEHPLAATHVLDKARATVKRVQHDENTTQEQHETAYD